MPAVAAASAPSAMRMPCVGSLLRSARARSTAAAIPAWEFAGISVTPVSPGSTLLMRHDMTSRGRCRQRAAQAVAFWLAITSARTCSVSSAFNSANTGVVFTE